MTKVRGERGRERFHANTHASTHSSKHTGKHNDKHTSFRLTDLVKLIIAGPDALENLANKKTKRKCHSIFNFPNTYNNIAFQTALVWISWFLQHSPQTRLVVTSETILNDRYLSKSRNGSCLASAPVTILSIGVYCSKILLSRTWHWTRWYLTWTWFCEKHLVSRLDMRQLGAWRQRPCWTCSPEQHIRPRWRIAKRLIAVRTPEPRQLGRFLIRRFTFCHQGPMQIGI